MAYNRRGLTALKQRAIKYKSQIPSKKRKLDQSRQQAIDTQKSIIQLSDRLDDIVGYLEHEVEAIERWESSVQFVRGSLRLLTPEQLKEINEFQSEFLKQLDIVALAAEPFAVLPEG